MKSFVLVLALAVSGCVQTRTLRPDSARLRADVNGRASTRTALVTLSWGETVRARSFHLAPDVATWIDLEDGTLRSVPALDVVRVRFLNRGRGALEGAGLGLAAAGALVAATCLAACREEYGGITVAIVGVTTPLPLALLGTIGGAVAGSKATYVAPRGEGLFSRSPAPYALTTRVVTPASVQTDAITYIARETGGAVPRRERQYSGRRAFTIVARYMNASADTVYLARSSPIDTPAFTVRSVSSEPGASAGSAYRPATSGVARYRPLAVAPGETRTDTLQIEGPRREPQTGAVRGLTQGQMALVYIASSSRDPWRVLPDSVVVSNPFEVRLE